MMKIFKGWIFLLLFFLSSSSFADDLKVKRIEVSSDADQFYPVYGKVLFIRNFYISPAEAKKYATQTNRVIKVPVSILIDKFDFERGDEISVADFLKLETFKYKIKDNAYVLLFDVPDGRSISNSSLILSDDPKIHKEISATLKRREIVSGVGYRGKDRKTKPSVTIDRFPVKDVPKKDPLYFTDTMKLLKLPFIKTGKLYQYEVIIYPVEDRLNPGGDRYTFIFKKKDGTYEGFRRHSFLLDERKKEMRVYDWLENAKIFKMIEDDGGRSPASEYLIICGPNELSLLELGGSVDNSEME